ncbi:MAG TPA: type VI secretion system tip protein TssI/VgrG [Thermoanaerobaculia bacterium]|nr:type VI secretion system tip protein TssI/VgrG [Thermoanaerobaculia bacterium]
MAQVLADTAQYSVLIGGEVFQVLTFHAHEEMSHLFRYSITLRSDNPQVNVKGLVRDLAKIHLSWEQKEKWWYGIVASASQINAGLPDLTQEDHEYGEYAIEVVPHYWMLTQKTNCKIFQWMSASDIIRAVLDKRGMAGKYKMKLTQDYKVREFCVQYRETDFAFLSRLMEEEGMFYFFHHDPELPPDVLIITDDASNYGDCYPEDTVQFKKGTGILSTDEEYLSSLTYEENAYTGQVGYRDFNYREPKKPPTKVIANAPDNGDFPVYDYHTERYREDPRGQFLARMAVEAQAAMRKTLSAAGNFRSIGAGHVFTLEKAWRDDLNGPWVVVSASFSASQQDGGVDYSVSFTAIPADRTFRALPRTPQPSLNMQTAYVVGPPGAPIYMDDYGRAKVQFHWDLDHQYDPDSSCWIRVAQPYAGMDQDSGDKHGFQWHPLVGDEVVVDFLEGDPDNPIIVGSVYNFINMQPIKPDQLIRSEIRSPYQHLLAFDDKEKYIQINTPYPHTLRMDDPGKHIHLTTQYAHALKMQDAHKDYNNIPSITLETGGAETIKMEDGQPDYGNNVKVSTADGHFLHFAEGPSGQGIIAATRKANVVVLNDQNKNITVQTTNGHRVLMDDANETIVVTSKDKHRIEINDKNRFIEIADSSGQHRFTIDIAGKQLTISTDTGSIDILAPKGTVKIDAKAVKVKAETSVDVECNNMKTKADTNVSVEAQKVKTDATSIQEKATADIKMQGLNITSEASMSNKTKGTFVNSEASGINTIKGTLVKIN